MNFCVKTNYFVENPELEPISWMLRKQYSLAS